MMSFSFLSEGSDGRHRISGAGSLTIDPAKEGDDGTYMCRAENHVDSVDTSATLEVQGNTANDAPHVHYITYLQITTTVVIDKLLHKLQQ